MKIKRIKKLKVNSFEFKIIWDKNYGGGDFHYGKKEITIGVKRPESSWIFMIICHEVMELCAVEMNVRLHRPDCDSDYIFVYDHRQHETMMNMFSSLISQFIV